MKRIISFLLVLALLFCSVPFTSAKDAAVDSSPIIMLLGYSSSPLYLNAGQPEEEQVWGLDFDNILDRVLINLPTILIGLIKGLIFGKYDTFIKVIGEQAYQVLEKLTMNPDGSSKYSVSKKSGSARNFSVAGLKASNEPEFIQLRPYVEEFAKTTPEDRIFFFFNDWRESMIDIAGDLDAYITEIKALTGSDTVRLFGSSHGGEIISAYLYKYADKQDVSKVVMEFPALGGTSMITAFLERDSFAFNLGTFTRFAQAGALTEAEWEWLTGLLSVDFLYEPFLDIIHTYLFSVVGYLGSVWDFIPNDDYDRLKEKLLNPVLNKELIEKSDIMHYEVMGNMSAVLNHARDMGTEVFIVANTDNQNVLSTSLNNSDGLLDLKNCTGVYAAQLGDRFDKGYVQKFTVCKNKSHYHISPGQNIDASAAYLPEHTWFIHDQFHGQSLWDPYSFSLCSTLFMTDRIKNIYSDKSYPQFAYAQSPADNICVQYNSGGYGFLTDSDNSLIVRNLSKKNNLRLLNITQDGSGLSYKVDKDMVCAPGESVTVPITGKLTSESRAYVPLKIFYVQITMNNFPMLSSKSFDVTANVYK